MTGPAYPSGAQEILPIFVGFVLLSLTFFMLCYLKNCLSFSLLALELANIVDFPFVFFSFVIVCLLDKIKKSYSMFTV